MNRRSETLGVIPFGQALIETLDLDPVYVAVDQVMPSWQLKRWLLAYWMFYHAGVAAKIAESEAFYRTCSEAHHDKWPRGKERRHFRGKTSQCAIIWLCTRFPNPEEAIDSLLQHDTLSKIKKEIMSWPYFGNWIAFKAADMLERLLGHPIKFDYSDLNFYKEPLAGAALAYPAMPLATVVQKLEWALANYYAPPRNDRSIGIQEVETILCKWKSHYNGHYYVGQDTLELTNALTSQDWGLLSANVYVNLATRLLMEKPNVNKIDGAAGEGGSNRSGEEQFSS